MSAEAFRAILIHISKLNKPTKVRGIRCYHLDFNALMELNDAYTSSVVYRVLNEVGYSADKLIRDSYFDSLFTIQSNFDITLKAINGEL